MGTKATVTESFEGRNGTFEILSNNNLRITLTKEGRKERKEHKHKSDGEFLWDMFEDIFCNSSFEELRPEVVGALTDSIILGYDIPKDEDGDIMKFDEFTKVWWFPNYMVTSINNELKTNKECYLTFAE
jgi:hypothetical protein